MIEKRFKAIVEGHMTQTRKVVGAFDNIQTHLGLHVIEAVYTTNRCKFRVGQKHSIIPQIKQPQVYYRYVDGHIQFAHLHSMPHLSQDGLTISQLQFARTTDDWRGYLKAVGYQPLFIRLSRIQRERLQKIHPADLQASGLATEQRFIDIWDCLNDTKWAKNPLVWVLDFEQVTG